MKNILTTFSDFNYDETNSAVTKLITNNQQTENEFLSNRINLTEYNIVAPIFNAYTNYNDIAFLYDYTNFVISNLFVYLEANDEFKNKDNLTKFFDIINSLIAVTISRYSNANICEALRTFIYNFIKIIIPDFKFALYLSASAKFSDESKYTIAVDPVIDKKINLEHALNFASYINTLLSFLLSDKKYCTIFFIASDSWISDTNENEIFAMNLNKENNTQLTFIDDNIIIAHLKTLNYFGQTSKIEQIKEKYNVDYDDLKMNLGNIPFSYEDDEDDNAISIDWESYFEPFYNNAVPNIHSYINKNTKINIFKNALISIFPTKMKNSILPLFKHIHNLFWDNNENEKEKLSYDISNDIHKYYGNKNIDFDDIITNIFSNEKSVKENNVEVETVSNEDNFADWNADCSKLNVSEVVTDFTSYINEMLKSYKKTKNKIDENVLSKMATAYNAEIFNFQNISKNDTIFTINSIINGEPFLFTFNENNDRIINIKYKI